MDNIRPNNIVKMVLKEWITQSSLYRLSLKNRGFEFEKEPLFV